MRKGPETHHVVPNPKGGWDVKRGGAPRASSRHDIKQDAVDRGRAKPQSGHRAANSQPGRADRQKLQPRRRPLPSRGLNKEAIK